MLFVVSLFCYADFWAKKLKQTGCILESTIGVEVVADYLLYWLNKNGNFKYLSYFDLSAPSNNITQVLTHGAVKYNLINKTRSMDTGQVEKYPKLEQVAERFVRSFRKGEFGPVCLDNDLLQ